MPPHHRVGIGVDLVQVLAGVICALDLDDLPGNIRVLDLPQIDDGNGRDSSLKQQIRDYEQAIIRAAIDAANGDRKIAADRLGIGVSSLYRKLEAKN